MTMYSFPVQKVTFTDTISTSYRMMAGNSAICISTDMQVMEMNYIFGLKWRMRSYMTENYSK